ncbi:MAG TPA: hypothetical protein VHS09_02075 [Polyangiaceae bacterium]|nr:hypothetical protein [Polyangiaceae bacterium]
MGRGLASSLVVGSFAALLACAPAASAEDWTCDFDASEPRPLADPDATAGEGGSLPPAECQATCGPPATACTITVLDGGEPGAICPVCTF